MIDTSKEGIKRVLDALPMHHSATIYRAGRLIEALDASLDAITKQAANAEGALNYLMNRMGEIRDLRAKRAATGFPVGVNTDAEFVGHMEKLAEVAIDSATAIRYSGSPAPVAPTYAQPVCRPEVNGRERTVVASAICQNVGNIFNEQTLENLTYAILTALRCQSFADERARKDEG